MRISIPIAAGGGRSNTRMPMPSASLEECLDHNGKIDRAKAQVALADRMFFCPSSDDDDTLHVLDPLPKTKLDWEREATLARKEARKRKRGGACPLKPRSIGEVMATPGRGTKFVCDDCPLWKPCYCPIIVATRIANHPACRYGIQKINNERSKKWHRENYKLKQKDRKEVIEMGKCCGGKKGCKGGGKKGK